jgi:hypothetical protein
VQTAARNDATIAESGIGWVDAMNDSISDAQSQQRAKERFMSKEQENKAIVARWFTEFWGNP